jgi:membrane-associated phospholipid phosphatase
MDEFASRARRAFLALILVPALATSLAAQDTTSNGRTIVPRDTSDAHRHQTLFTYRDAALAVAFTGLTIAMFPVDRHIAISLQDPDLRANRFFGNTATSVEKITSPGAFLIGGGLYAIGRFGGHKDLEDLGWHGTEAVLLATGVTTVLKDVLGRARPFVVGDTVPHSFSFGKGFSGGSDYQSFPSGHTTAAFAAAASVTSEVRRIWPQAVWYVAPVMYGGATVVGLSRMYHNAHWASDVVLGAAIGTFSGLKVVRYSHAHPDNKLDKWIMSATFVPNLDGGGSLAFTMPTP